MYREDGDKVTLEMTRDDYEFLLWTLGTAAGRASQDRDKTRFWECLRFTNRLLDGSPRFKPYPVPEPIKTDADSPAV